MSSTLHNDFNDICMQIRFRMQQVTYSNDNLEKIDDNFMLFKMVSSTI